MSDMMVTVSFDKVREYEDTIKRQSERIAELEKAVEDAKLGDADSVARQYAQAFDHAFKIAKFAVANCPVMQVRGWPYTDLRAVARSLVVLPMIDEMDREISNDLLLFAADAEKWEGYRAQNIHKQVLAEDNLRRNQRAQEIIGDPSVVSSPRPSPHGSSIFDASNVTGISQRMQVTPGAMVQRPTRKKKGKVGRLKK